MNYNVTAAFVAVGTELTSGELVNTNATWVSSQLENIGLEVALHLTVPDDHALILEAIDNASSKAKFVFISGGLGPTKDDFTRELVAKWAGRALVRNEELVAELRAKFAELGRTFHSFQEQQCEFPEGARVIKNHAGTAHAFHIEKEGCQIWTLPGPPREIASVWPEIESQLKELATEKKATLLKSWLCFGEGESVVAKITEDVIAGKPFTTGYRAHAPYVEVKIWGTAEDFEKFDQLKELTQALDSLVVSRERKTFCRQFAAKLKPVFEIVDGVSRGQLIADLNEALKDLERPVKSGKLTTLIIEKGFSQIQVKDWLAENRSGGFMYFVLPADEESKYWMGKTSETAITLQKVSFPAQVKIGARFRALWAAEKACAHWLSL